MSITWKFCRELVNKNVLDDLEIDYAFPFPVSLKEIVSKYNAGVPDKRVYDTPRKGMVFAGLLSFNENDDDNAYLFIKNLCRNGKLTLLPFGTDGFGNALCVKKNGEVVFWSHETEAIVTIAGSLDEFWKMLHS